MDKVPAFLEKFPGNRRSLNKLRSRLRSARAIAFVGAGASAALYPLWTGLLDLLAAEAVELGDASRADRAAWLQIAERQPLRAASAIKAALGSTRLAQLIDHIFGRKFGIDGRAFTSVHSAIVQLPFRGLVTTNYDPSLLEARHDIRPEMGATGWGVWRQDDAVRAWLTGDVFRSDTTPILFAHGIHNWSESIVLTYEDYSNAYKPGLFSRCVESLWAQHNLVSLGSGFPIHILTLLRKNSPRS